MHWKESQVEGVYGRGVLLLPRAIHVILLFGIAAPRGQSRCKEGCDNLGLEYLATHFAEMKSILAYKHT